MANHVTEDSGTVSVDSKRFRTRGNSIEEYKRIRAYESKPFWLVIQVDTDYEILLSAHSCLPDLDISRRGVSVLAAVEVSTVMRPLIFFFFFK
jgi:hypothetical protein